MQITYTPYLKKYMQKKGFEHIIIEIADCNLCGFGYTEVTGRFARESDLEKISGRVLQGEIGDITVTVAAVDYDDEIEIGLRNFFGAHDITIKGIHF